MKSESSFAKKLRIAANGEYQLLSSMDPGIAISTSANCFVNIKRDVVAENLGFGVN